MNEDPTLGTNRDTTTDTTGRVSVKVHSNRHVKSKTPKTSPLTTSHSATIPKLPLTSTDGTERSPEKERKLKVRSRGSEKHSKTLVCCLFL